MTFVSVPVFLRELRSLFSSNSAAEYRDQYPRKRYFVNDEVLHVNGQYIAQVIVS
jgi:hypothetical protein